ncbi:PucR family transcriptional regulator [Williamsia sterculiae]|uniref:PucR C-terminal helix-turn-helix domain-containing protein n=1 Tax=Williamsia sterculiae TaxID=1344003 RepID=A0A1N7GZ52_9NOCA|nr:PucR family transcriptional regulator [Williamsia sterculiae]SIS17865.1 PucR C-terminal helix-turn-helix domain-containing protein [Williamsia sterculiae]
MPEPTPPVLTAMTREVVRRVAEVLPALTDRVLDRMLTDIPLYGSGAAGDRAAVRGRLAANLSSAVQSLDSRSHDPGPAAETGRERAQQEAALADVLGAYRLAFTELWDELVRASHLPPAVPAAALVDLSSAIFWLHNAESDALMNAFRDETHQILLTRERERAALVDVLVTQDVGTGTLLHVARSLRLPMEGRFVVVTGDSELGRDPMPRIASALAAVDVRSVWRLRRETSVGVLSLPERSHDAAVFDVLARHATASVGVSPVFGHLSRAPWALELALLALRQIRGETAVQQFDDNPLNILLAAAPQVSLETAHTVLGPILDLGDDQRDLLVTTVNAWVTAGGSADATAAALYCHPNTIRKRLRRVEDATGRDLRRPGDVVEVVAACRAWTQLHPRGRVD